MTDPFQAKIVLAGMGLPLIIIAQPRKKCKPRGHFIKKQKEEFALVRT
jgi:hypothetical protein